MWLELTEVGVISGKSHEKKKRKQTFELFNLGVVSSHIPSNDNSENSIKISVLWSLEAFSIMFSVPLLSHENRKKLCRVVAV